MTRFVGNKPHFKNREEAAQLLIEKLSDYRGMNPLVLAIPCGGVGMGRMIADALKGDLDVALAHKLAMPDDPELAVGAVSENGAYFTASYLATLGVTQDWVQKEVKKQTASLQEQRRLFTVNGPRISAADRLVILVDDGIATGSTTLAAIRGVAAEFPRKIVVATPVAPPDTIELIRKEADEVILIAAPKDFRSVSDFYENFPQVSDTEVAELLNRQPIHP